MNESCFFYSSDELGDESAADEGLNESLLSPPSGEFSLTSSWFSPQDGKSCTKAAHFMTGNKSKERIRPAEHFPCQLFTLFLSSGCFYSF